jgi:hypothetical protein
MGAKMSLKPAIPFIKAINLKPVPMVWKDLPSDYAP